MIKAVIFDMGGTLEEVYFDEEMRKHAASGLRDLMARHGIDTGLSAGELYKYLKTGMDEYGRWRELSEQELPPERLWPEFIFRKNNLPGTDWDQAGEELSFYWDMHFARRTMRPETPALLSALKLRGLKLGLISNIFSRLIVPYKLEEYGITRYFEAVLMSSAFGWRKPNPKIFLEISRLIGIRPDECAFVGDTVSRDIAGARRSGYGMAIQIISFLTTISDTESDREKPDAVVKNLMEIPDIIAAG